MSARYSYAPHRFTFSNQSTVFVSHGFDRAAAVVCFDHTGEQIAVESETYSPGVTRVRFYNAGVLSPITGTGYAT